MCVFYEPVFQMYITYHNSVSCIRNWVSATIHSFFVLSHRCQLLEHPVLLAGPLDPPFFCMFSLQASPGDKEPQPHSQGQSFTPEY